MELPELRLENRRVIDPANAHRRNQASPNIQQQKVQLSPPRSRPPLPQEAPRLEVEHHLNLRLRNELPRHVSTQWQIAQPHILRDILTSKEILSLLKEYQSSGMLSKHENVESMCRKVRGHGHPSCIVVLAMLILVDKGYTIGEVLRDQVFDDNLPIVTNNQVDPVLFSWDQSKDQWRQLRCFENYRTWGVQAKLDICKWQWFLRVPRMSVLGPAFRAYENKFGRDVILPWSSKSKDGEVMRNERTETWGGYDAVCKCHIDDRFHGFHDILQKIGLSGGKGFFALKVSNQYTPAEQARMSTPITFDNERQQLNRFSGIAHSHLITLLAAFEQEGTNKNFFVFPWAECDLSAYWERPHHQDARWVSKQLVGLVGALNEIHNPAQHSQTLGSQVFGRHGDLKPDNILWFTPYRGDPRGILVLSDPGFTAVNSEVSRSKQTHGKPRTPTYRPPELDINGANSTREYDVWSLGCIFLEMMTWLLGGHELVDDFKAKRKTLKNGVMTSMFFTFVGDRPIVKQEVTEWINNLRSHEKCTKFVHDVLDVVQNEMIIPSVWERSKVHDLKNQFQAINQRCQEDEAYYEADLPRSASLSDDYHIRSNQTWKPGSITATPDDTSSNPASTWNHRSIDSPELSDLPGSIGPVGTIDFSYSSDSGDSIESTESFEVLGSVEPHESTEVPASFNVLESISAPESSEMPEFTETVQPIDSSRHNEYAHITEPLAEAYWPVQPQEFNVLPESTITESTGSTATDSVDISDSSSFTSFAESKLNVDTASNSENQSALNPHTEHEETISLVYSNSGLPETAREIFVQSFAEKLLNEIMTDISLPESLDRASDALIENLKGFATRLGLNTQDRTQLGIVLFAHKHGSEIKDAFQALLDDRKKASEREHPQVKASNIDTWRLEVQTAPPESLPAITSLYDEPSSVASPSPSPSIPDVRRSDQDPKDEIAKDKAAPPVDQEDLKDQRIFKLFLKYHDNVIDTAAYEWLAKTLRRDALLQPAAQNHMQMISKSILHHLPIRKISRTSPSKVYKVHFVLDWNPCAFVRDLGSHEQLERALLGAITFTGSPNDAQALMCSDYLTQTWPTNGEAFMRLIVKLIGSSPGVGCSETLPDGTKISAVSEKDDTVIDVAGVADAVAEVGQQLAWIGAALRSAPPDFEQGLCQCSSEIVRKRIQDEEELERTFAIKFEIRGPTDYTNATGSCWHSMVRNPILVTGFPIREKSAHEAGIEMPFDVMACLARSNRVVNFDGKVILKGFSTMLTAVQITAEYLIWHYTFRADGTRIPFFEASTPEQDGIHFGMLETHRHIVGWCSSAKCYAGDPEAEYDIRSSSQPPFENPFTLEKVSLSVGKVFGASGSFSFPVNNLPAHINLDGYGSRLGFLEQEYVVFWDAEDKRGWLVNGTSALLYLVRARFNRVSSGNFRSLYTSSLSDLTESVDRFHPTKSAAEVLCNKQNRKLLVGSGRTEQYSEQKTKDGNTEDTKTVKQNDVVFESFVEHFMSYLEQIKDHQTRLVRPNGLKLKAHVSRHLEGWDIVDLITSSNPTLRVTQLDSLGWGWVDFVRSINAITLFGKGFGDLIKPEGSQVQCSEWRTLPKHKYYLAASATDLMTAMERYGTADTSPPQLVHGYYWNSPIACPCSQTDNFTKAHFDPVQILLPTKSILLKATKMKRPMELEQDNDRAAFVFGHNMSFPVFWRADGRNVEVTKEQEASDLSDLPALGAEELGSQAVDGSSVTSHGIQTSISAQQENTSMSSDGSTLTQPAAPLRNFPNVPITEPVVYSSSNSRRSRLWRKDILTLNFLRSVGKRK